MNESMTEERLAEIATDATVADAGELVAIARELVALRQVARDCVDVGATRISQVTNGSGGLTYQRWVCPGCAADDPGGGEPIAHRRACCHAILNDSLLRAQEAGWYWRALTGDVRATRAYALDLQRIVEAILPHVADPLAGVPLPEGLNLDAHQLALLGEFAKRIGR